METPQPAEMNQHVMGQGYQSQVPQRPTMGNLPPNASAQAMFLSQPPGNFHQHPHQQQQQYFTPPPSAYSHGSPYSGPYEPTAPPPTPPVTDPSVLQHQHQQVQPGYQQPLGYQQGFEPVPGEANHNNTQQAPPQQPTQPQNLL